MMPTTLQHAADGLTPIARGISNLVAEGTHVKGTDEERLVVWPKCDDHLRGHGHTLNDSDASFWPLRVSALNCAGLLPNSARPPLSDT